MERYQPTIEELESNWKRRHALLCHGPSVAEFSLRFTKRDPETHELTLAEGIIDSDLIDYRDAFMALSDAVPDSKDLLAATGITRIELDQFANRLSNIATLTTE